MENSNLSTLEHLKKLTILCVEDNKTTQILYDSILEDVVAEIIVAYDGQEGYDKYRENDIDIIISDYDMPVLNGLGMIKKIREYDKDIPIILVTAIDDTHVIIEALQLGVNNFVKKPIQPKEILDAIDKDAKILLANAYLKAQQKKKLYELEEKEKYTSYQEDLGFSKELNILRNDFYYQMIVSGGISLVDFMYEPLDVMSGDAYSARRIDEQTTFYLMVDGMGKGLSASLTAMLITSFINHTIDTMLRLGDFDLHALIHESMEYVKPILLEEEVLAIDYVLMNYEEGTMHYSKFAMPVLLMTTKDDTVVRIKSNNPPLCKWSDTFAIDTHNIKNIRKFLIYSDGIVENETKFDGKPYSDFIEEDFINAFTKEDLKHSFLEKIDRKEDDVSFIYIHRFCCASGEVDAKVFESTLDDVDAANAWYNILWDNLTDDMRISYGANVVFTELFMNAYEHGNLGIDSHAKNVLLEKDVYFETLKEKEKACNKKINVTVNEVLRGTSKYIITQISDEGEGFDTHLLSDIFRSKQTFNGRGVFVSRKNSVGIYYNAQGNSVLYISKVS
ncbi:response regulator [Sulfurimonas sp. SAG-AH-194-I05]|nr:response regulator [Sulfurimonas sp. SAG-AH-194-I05]MDF1875073.1 response regulator [Sulfurimonas sp. SAG-AH-194-I05]